MTRSELRRAVAAGSSGLAGAGRGYSSEEDGYGDMRRPGMPGPDNPGSSDPPDLGTAVCEALASGVSGKNDSDIGAVWEEEADGGTLGNGPN